MHGVDVACVPFPGLLEALKWLLTMNLKIGAILQNICYRSKLAFPFRNKFHAMREILNIPQNGV